jgi:peroxiredoxin family protein
MAASTLFMVLASPEHEKVQLAGMMASVAAVSERPTQLFVSMAAIMTFQKGLSAAERYKGGAFSAAMLKKGAPDAVELFAQGKMLGDLRVIACSMALDIQGWTLDDLVEDLFDEAGGLTKFLSDAETGELIVL